MPAQCTTPQSPNAQHALTLFDARSDMKDVKKACKIIGQMGGGVPAEGDPDHPRTPGDFSQCHPSLMYDEETGVIKKNEGEEQMWSTALSSTVMQPDTGKYVMKCVVDPPDGETAPNAEIMLGVADADYDVEGGDPDSQGDESATLGAAFTAKGWGWYVLNGAAYHREGDAEDGKNKVAGNKKWDHTKSKAHAGQRVRLTYDSDKGTLFVHRQGKPLGQLCSGIDGPVRWMVQQQDPESSVKVKKH